MKVPAILLCLLASIAMTSCGDRITCAGMRLSRIVPSDTTIPVRTSFVARYQEGGTCGDIGDAHYQTIAVTWFTSDSAIVSLDSTTGSIVGRAVGDAHVTTSRGLDLLVRVR